MQHCTRLRYVYTTDRCWTVDETSGDDMSLLYSLNDAGNTAVDKDPFVMPSTAQSFDSAPPSARNLGPVLLLVLQFIIMLYASWSEAHLRVLFQDPWLRLRQNRELKL